MKNGFRASMAWLHTWSGLLAGWLLFAIFLTGTASYYRAEITQWMRPEARPQTADITTAARQALEHLRSVAPEARQWTLDLPTARVPFTTVFFLNDPGNQPVFGKEYLDPATGLPLTMRETHGGDSLYYFHFDLLMPSIWGRLVVGFCAVAMLVAIISGIVTHRRFFRDFFTFRPHRNQRSWLDAHNLLGVTALPYHLLITYSGVVTLLLLYMPWGVTVAYKGDRTAFLEDLGVQPRVPAAAGRRVPLADMGAMIGTAYNLWDGGRPGRIVVYRPDDASARVALYRADTETLSYRSQWLLLEGASGAVLRAEGRRGTAARTAAVFYGLHLARFSEPVLRAFLFFSGLAGTAMVATGLLLWTVKRRSRLPDPARPPLGFSFAERLNVATIAGLPAGIAGLFWANRLLPLELQARADWEVRCLFLVWIGMTLWIAIRPRHRIWIEALGTCAALFAGLPLVNALTTDRGLPASLVGGDWVFAGFDLAMLGCALVFVVVAGMLDRKHRDVPETESPALMQSRLNGSRSGK